jgi:prophage regulatory protein
MQRHVVDGQLTLLARAYLRRYGILFSAAHLLRLEAAGHFPKRLRLSPLRVAWVKAEVLQWIEQRAADRSKGATDDI